MKKISDIVILNNYKLFIDRYQKYMSKEMLSNIKKYFSLDLKNHNLYYMQEIYSYLNMFKDKDPYDYILSLIKYEYGIENDILSMENGIIPILSKKIDSEQSNYGRGNIVSYDPFSVMSFYGTMPILKDESKIDCSQFNILVSTFNNNYPNLVDIAINNHQDFLFLLNPYRYDGLRRLTQYYLDEKIIAYCEHFIPKTKVLCKNKLSTGKENDALIIYTTNKN